MKHLSNFKSPKSWVPDCGLSVWFWLQKSAQTFSSCSTNLIPLNSDTRLLLQYEILRDSAQLMRHQLNWKKIIYSYYYYDSKSTRDTCDFHICRLQWRNILFLQFSTKTAGLQREIKILNLKTDVFITNLFVQPIDFDSADSNVTF